jgi:two-component system, NarL family, invasion response regulator UvrY
MRRILIVDDHEVVRDGIKRILCEQTADIHFGEAGSVSEALAQSRHAEWDVVVLDLSLAGRSGLDVLKELKQIRPELPVLILSMHGEEEYVRRAFKAGAAGYVTKDSSRGELAEAVSRVAEGGRYVSRSLTEAIVTLEPDSERLPHESLSNREFEVLKAIGSGKTVRQIAQLFTLSDKTISTYRTRLLRKMGLKNNAELVRYAIQTKLVE